MDPLRASCQAAQSTLPSRHGARVPTARRIASLSLTRLRNDIERGDAQHGDNDGPYEKTNTQGYSSATFRRESASVFAAAIPL